MWRELLHAEGNSLLVIIEIEDYNIQFLIEFNQFFWVIHAAPRHVCDVHESVNSAKVNEHTIRRDVLNSTLQYLTFLESTNDDSLLLLQFSLNERFVRDDHVLEFLIDFDNLEVHLFSDVNVEISDGLHIDLGSG